MLPALTVGTAIHLFPYSPRWLAMRGRNQDSLASLAKLRRRSTRDDMVQMEFKEIVAEIRFQKELRESKNAGSSAVMVEVKEWLELFRPAYFKRTSIALAIPFFQQVRL